MYAIIRTGGKQAKVRQGDVIATNSRDSRCAPR